MTKTYHKKNSSYEVRHGSESQAWTGFSVALHLLLPLAGLTLLLGRQDLFENVLLQLDRRLLSAFCPSLSRRQKFLRWASSKLPETWSSQSKTLSGGLVDMWTDGSLLCTLINSAIVGACPNPHRHWRKPPSHAQALAYKYLGILPVFTEEDFKKHFSITQEKNFMLYLVQLQQVINRLSVKDAGRKYSSQYVARGMGLFSGEQHKKAVFYLYANSNATTSSNVLVHIRGPYRTYGEAAVPVFKRFPATSALTIGPNNIIQCRSASIDSKQTSILKRMSIDFSTLISRKASTDEIPIEIEMERDRAKISYIPNNDGMYEVSLICDGELIRGSPYSVHIIHNNLNESEQTIATDKLNGSHYKKRIISRIIDFIDEKIVVPPAKRLSKAFSFEYFARNLNQIKPNNTYDSCGEEPYSPNTNSNNSIGNIIEKQKLEGSNNEKGKIDTKLNCRRISEEKNDDHNNNNNSRDTDTNINNNNNNNKGIDNIETAQTGSRGCREAGSDSAPDYSDKAKTDLLNKYVEIKKPEIINTTNFEIKKDISHKSSDIKALKNIVNICNKVEDDKDKLTKIISQMESKNINMENSESRQRFTPNRRHSCVTDDSDESSSVKDKKRSNNRTTQSFTCSQSKNTSPICPNHIAPEVEHSFQTYKQLSVAKKREQFAKQCHNCHSDSIHSSISENEDVDSVGCLYESDQYSTTNLSETSERKLGNYVDINYQSKVISNAVSMPNISSCINNNTEDGDALDHNINTFRGIVEQRKQYWDKFSTSTSNLSSCELRPKYRAKHYASSLKSAKLKLKDTFPSDYNNSLRSTSLTKSADDILTATEKTYICKSISMCDNTDLGLASIEERKKLLLKEHYAEEKVKSSLMKRRVLADGYIKLGSQKNTPFKINQDRQTNLAVGKRIEVPNIVKDSTVGYQKEACNVQSLISEFGGIDVKENRDNTTLGRNDFRKSFKSQFKRAVNYFKNLEENSKLKTTRIRKQTHKRELDKEATRRLSLDTWSEGRNKQKGGGSLQLPSVSDKFFVSNLYNDVTYHKGSFKGTPNKSAVTETLASMQLRDNEWKDSNFADEDEIRFNLFMKKSKNKVRKHIKSLFDINY